MAVRNTVGGTFEDEGSSDPLICNGQAIVMLKFAGTASVTLEARPETTSTWFAVKDYTASACEVVGTPIQDMEMEYRLTCGAHTDDVDYALAG